MSVGGEALAGLLNLLLRFEQQRLNLSFGKAAVEIEEGAVLGATRVAVAFGLAAFKQPFQEGGVKEMRQRFEGTQQMSLAVAQSQSRGPFEGEWPTHIYA